MICQISKMEEIILQISSKELVFICLQRNVARNAFLAFNFDSLPRITVTMNVFQDLIYFTIYCHSYGLKIFLETLNRR